jgi:ABC-type branched-subunit amino acid transport system substrate-binding protein
MLHAPAGALVSLVVAMALAAAGATRGGAATRAAPVRGVTRTAVVVAGLTAEPAGQGADVGATARFQRSGRVGGRRIEYLGARSLDDRTAATRLAQQVFAVVPAVGVSVEARTLADARVPFVGVAASEDWVGNRWGYGITGAPPSARSPTASPAWGIQLRALLGTAGGKTVAIATDADAAARAEARAARASVRAVGFHAVVPVVVPTPFDAAAVASALATAAPPPDAVLLLAAPARATAVAQQLAALGFTGTIGMDDELYSPSSPGPAAGLTILTTIAPLEANTAALRKLVDDVHVVDPSAVITPSVVQGYFAADFFLAVLARVGRHLDPARFEAVANSAGFTYAVPATVGRSNWPAMHRQAIPCGALAQSDGTAYVVAEPYRCGAPVAIGRRTRVR